MADWWKTMTKGQSSLLFARSYSTWQNVRSVLQCNSAITGFPVPSCHSGNNYILMHILLHFAVSGEWGISTSWGLFFVPSLTSIGHISILCMIKKVSKKYLSYKIVIDSRILNSGTRRSVTQEYSCVTFWVSPVSTRWVSYYRSLPGIPEDQHNVICPYRERLNAGGSWRKGVTWL